MTAWTASKHFAAERHACSMANSRIDEYRASVVVREQLQAAVKSKNGRALEKMLGTFALNHNAAPFSSVFFYVCL